jgi:nitrate reductase NapE component
MVVVLRPKHWQKHFNFPKMSVFERLRNSMKRKPTSKNSDWNISFWVVALWPLIVVAIVAIGFLAPALIKTL